MLICDESLMKSCVQILFSVILPTGMQTAIIVNMMLVGECFSTMARARLAV